MKTVERKNRSPESEFVVFESIPSETYKGILDVLGENHLRHLYDHWTLEMRLRLVRRDVGRHSH